MSCQKISTTVGGTSRSPAPPPPPPNDPTFKTKFEDFISDPVVAAFCAGGVAGAVSRTVVSPLERLKILFQVQDAGRSEYKGSVLTALKKMWKEEGWRGFMRGNGTNCVRIVPYSAVQFGSYNLYRRVSCFRKESRLDSLRMLITGRYSTSSKRHREPLWDR
jgi:solute carrier family 25 (mitochondrial phosphate transporter), member 23/24/25/41